MKSIDYLLHQLSGNVVVLGVGNTLRGDDGAGPLLLRQLNGITALTLLDCGEVPENYLGDVARIHPDTVLIVDTVDMGMEPGAVAILDESDLAQMGWSTHHASLRPVVRYIETDAHCDVLILGIQPKSTELGAPISDEVRHTIVLLRDIITSSRMMRE